MNTGVNKRKIICLMLALAAVFWIASAGSEDILRGYSSENGYVYVKFGSYPQRIDGGIVGDPGQTWVWRTQYSKNKGSLLSILTLDKEPIVWRVLSVNDGRAFLCSEYILFSSYLDKDKGKYAEYEGDFPFTDLSKLLNGDFLQYAFTESERGLIVPDDYYGNIYLLSAEELKDKTLGFGAESKRNAWSTEVAVRVYGTYIYQKESKCVSPYWTRTPSQNKGAGIRVKQGGKMGYYSCMYEECGVRPVINIRQGGYRIVSGNGTIEDPFVIESKEVRGKK